VLAVLERVSPGYALPLWVVKICQSASLRQNVVSRCAIFSVLLRDPRVHIRVGQLSETRQHPCDLYCLM